MTSVIQMIILVMIMLIGFVAERQQFSATTSKATWRK